MLTPDVTIIGAGVVGLATAFQLSRREPSLSIVVVDKESELARHQTGHNSGVLHTGIYYKPGSLKAELCRDGRSAMVEYCASEGIPHEICGKVIVALNEADLVRLDTLEERARLNGVRASRITAQELRQLEPRAAGIAALWVPDAGIVNYRAVCQHYAKRIVARTTPGSGKGTIVYSANVLAISRRKRSTVLHTSQGAITTQKLVNCGGLQSDRVARIIGQHPKVCIVPFKGEYYALNEDARGLVRNLIYPVPDPAFPFLGVHFTRMISGAVECGPNAVLAMGRESYEPWQPDIGDMASTFLATPGFWTFARRHWRAGVGEVRRSLSKSAFVRALQRLVPDIRSEHLSLAPAGIRAQAMSADGRLVDDFVFEETGSILSVCNAPSPAATASLAIGNVVAERILKMDS